MKWQKKFVVNNPKSVFLASKEAKIGQNRVSETGNELGFDDVLSRLRGGARHFHLTSAQYFGEEIHILVANIAGQR